MTHTKVTFHAPGGAYIGTRYVRETRGIFEEVAYMKAAIAKAHGVEFVIAAIAHPAHGA